MKSSTRPERPRNDGEHKTELLEVRLTPSAKRIIQRAMWVTGLSASDLACEGARRVVDELTGADREAFLDAVMNRPEPTTRLVAALKRHRELLG